MENNQCFIVMPQEEPQGYAPGHFDRVYEYVIVPACRASGFFPTRADRLKSDRPLDVVKEIIDSGVAIFDLSAGNAMALYGLAIRNVLGLPFVLVKDTRSVVMFDSAKFGQVEYDESLRIDTVQKEVEAISTAIKKADAKKDRHELLDRLSIGLPQYAPPPVMEVVSSAPVEMTIVEEEKPKEKLPIISPLPDYVGEPFTEAQILKLKAGDVLFHLVNGKGKVNSVSMSGKERVANIQFESGPKLLVVTASDFFRRVKG